jgi:ubiquinone/menaquinone biosynthesis C-methylase UbiE
MRETGNNRIVDQFTRQAALFAQAAPIKNPQLLGRIAILGELAAEDFLLDVACGPGLLACAFAPLICRATGIDLTPAMLRQAALLQEQNDLTNVSWTQGDVTRLPYRSQQFTLVTARFAFHHFPDPLAVLTEMVRVCQPDGRILVVDSAPAAGKADAFNQMERLRDPSHTRALCEEELLALFREAGLVPSKLDRFRLPGDLNALLARSFPHEGDSDRVRQLFENALLDDALDVMPVRDGANISYGFPVVAVMARKAASAMLE